MKKDFNYCKRWLRRNFPSQDTINIRCVSDCTFTKHQKANFDNILEELDGLCIYLMWENGEKTFLILIHKSLSDKLKVETLLHEYAHLLRYSLPDRGDYKWHDGVWTSIHNRLKTEWAKCISK